MKKFYRNKKILVTGGTGLIGIQLCNLLISYGAKVTVVSIDKKPLVLKNVKFLRTDLRILKNCIKVTKNMDFVFHLAGIKGSPNVASSKPYMFMTPMLMFNTNIIEAARLNNVKRFLYTSSIGVYKPDNIMKEESVWKTFPSRNDWYAGWVKRIGELQVNAFSQQYKEMKVTIVRPANVYGPFDNFKDGSSMVIPSLIKKFLFSTNKKVEVLGDGSNIRDFVYSKDVANGMLIVMKKSPQKPINLGSGRKVTIKKLVNFMNTNFNNEFEINWNRNVPTGDKIRLLDIRNAKKLGFKNNYSLLRGLKETIDWAKKNISKLNEKKYSAFDK